MILLPRQPSLLAFLPLGRSSRTLLSQSGITAERPLSPARVFINKPTQHKGIEPSRQAVQVLARLTGIALAFVWLSWFFRNVF